MADVLRGVDLGRPVPTCPEWTLADLAHHVGSVHRWATAMVRESSQERLARDELDLGLPEEDAGLADWLAEGAAAMADVFESADPGTPMWAWGAEKQAGFWPRRMVHETGIHRADAELALGVDPGFAPEIAADGIDELLDNLPHALYFAPQVAELRGGGESLVLASPDAGWWRIELGADGFTWTAGDGPPPKADATVTASATELLLVAYRRRDPAEVIDVAGDEALFAHWLAHSAL